MAKICVSDLMTDRVFSVRPDDSLNMVQDMMDSLHIRHMPVIDEEGALVGLVTQRDLLRTGLFADNDGSSLPLSERQSGLEDQTVDTVMTREPASVSPNDDIREAALTLMENKFGCTPVVEADSLVGILTESDFVRFVYRHAEDFSSIWIGSDSDAPDRDSISGSSSLGEGSRLTMAGGISAGIGGTEGSETGERFHSTARSGWGGIDDATSTSPSDASHRSTGT